MPELREQLDLQATLEPKEQLVLLETGEHPDLLVWTDRLDLRVPSDNQDPVESRYTK